jgi:hypothetical protein
MKEEIDEIDDEIACDWFFDGSGRGSCCCDRREARSSGMHG